MGIERRTGPGDDELVEQEQLQHWPSEPHEIERSDVEGSAIAKATRYNSARGYVAS